MTNPTARASAIMIAGHAMQMTDQEILTVAIDFLDIPNEDNLTDLQRTIRASFSTDDDFDDMIHELDHAMGNCTDDDPDCVWNDDEDDDSPNAAEESEMFLDRLNGDLGR